MAKYNKKFSDSDVEKIRKRMEQIGISTADLESISGISQRNIQRWITPDKEKRVAPGHKSVVRLAKALNIGTSDIYSIKNRNGKFQEALSRTKGNLNDNSIVRGIMRVPLVKYYLNFIEFSLWPETGYAHEFFHDAKKIKTIMQKFSLRRDHNWKDRSLLFLLY